jgi:hypothetical protein
MLTKGELKSVKAMWKIDTLNTEAAMLENLGFIMNSKDKTLSPVTLLNYLIDNRNVPFSKPALMVVQLSQSNKSI